MQEAINSNFPSLSKCKLELGLKETIILVAKIIGEVVPKVREGGMISLERAGALSKDIIESYYYFGLDELKYCFKLGLRGEFGPTYDKAYEALFTHWLEQYRENRMALAEKQSFEGHKRTRDSETKI